MGFAGADPRQLAPSVGTAQVGITISAVPSSANRNSRVRTRSNLLEGFNVTTSIFAAPAVSTGPQPHQILYNGGSQTRRQKRRSRRSRRIARSPYAGVPLEEVRRAAGDPQDLQRSATTRAPAEHRHNGYESDTSSQEYHHQRRNQQPRRCARKIHKEDRPCRPHDAVEEPRAARRTAARALGNSQDNDSETPIGEYYDPERRPDEFANLI